MAIPDPVYLHDADGCEFGLRCVCGEGRVDEILVTCATCGFRLHGMCVNVAREISGQRYVCPFCTSTRLRCLCGENMKYDRPLIRCVRCKLWSHKACERLEYGRNPPRFVCQACDPRPGKTYEIPAIRFEASDTAIVDAIVCVTPDTEELLSQIPDGALQQEFARDLESRELPLRMTIERYFHKFLGPI
jgi:hypothetical protein